MIKVDFDEKGIQAAERLMKLSPVEVSRGTIQAINRTLTRIGVLGAAEVRKRYSVKAGKVKKGAFSYARASSGRLRGKAMAKGSPLPLAAFTITQPKTGPLKAKVLRRNSTKPVRGLFIRSFPGGYRGPMVRRSAKAYPLRAPYGPSFPSMVKNETAVYTIGKEVEQFFQDRFTHEMEFRLGKGLGHY